MIPTAENESDLSEIHFGFETIRSTAVAVNSVANTRWEECLQFQELEKNTKVPKQIRRCIVRTVDGFLIDKRVAIQMKDPNHIEQHAAFSKDVS